jgi:NAD(P)-dependent dehydrogenase (short-subunit alcohol dehydrogenase family)
MKNAAGLFSLNGKVAAVIGGSGVLGGAMVQALAGAGAKTAIFYSGNPEGAEKQKSAVKELGSEAMICKADVRSEPDLERAFDAIEEKWNRIDILVNAPGVNSATPLMDITEEEWDQIMDINLKGVFLASRIAAKKMMDQNIAGSIINISSASSEIPLSKVFTYSISKAGMNNMTKFFAREWADHNIRVNAIMPGFFPAEQNRKILTKERTESIFNHTPMNRFGEPEELAGALIWLASNKASSFVTGTIVPVDGGFTSMTI